MPGSSSGSSAPVRRRVTIVNRRGLHARAAAKFVETAAAFDATVEVANAGQTVPGTSIMGLMMLAAGPGTQIELSAAGPAAAAVLDALVTLVEAKFGEDGDPLPPTPGCH